MPGPVEEANIAYLSFIGRFAAEEILLNIRNALHHKPNSEQDHPRDVPPRTEIGLGVLRDIGRVQDGNGERDGPDPDHLKDPEAQKGEELVADLVEAIVFSGFEYTEEEEAGEPGPPEHDEN